MPLERILTIGVYGFHVDAFFGALEAAGADLFCDLRARRGVRGRDYAFANATRLQTELASRKIEYRHYRALAPSSEIRTIQYEVDAAAGIGKRKRGELDGRFVELYRLILQTPAAQAALAEITDATAPVLFCVERLPEACHRSLVARELAKAYSIQVEDLTP